MPQLLRGFGEAPDRRHRVEMVAPRSSRPRAVGGHAFAHLRAEAGVRVVDGVRTRFLSPSRNPTSPIALLRQLLDVVYALRAGHYDSLDDGQQHLVAISRPARPESGCPRSDRRPGRPVSATQTRPGSADPMRPPPSFGFAADVVQRIASGTCPRRRAGSRATCGHSERRRSSGTPGPSPAPLVTTGMDARQHAAVVVLARLCSDRRGSTSPPTGHMCSHCHGPICLPVVSEQPCSGQAYQ